MFRYLTSMYLLVSVHFAHAQVECNITANNKGRISYEVRRGSDKISESYFNINDAILIRDEQVKLGACAWPSRIQECEIKSDTDMRISFTVFRGGEAMSESYFDVNNTIAMRNTLIANRICSFPNHVERCDIRIDKEGGVTAYSVYRGKEKLSESYLDEALAKSFLTTLKSSAICNN